MKWKRIKVKKPGIHEEVFVANLTRATRLVVAFDMDTSTEWDAWILSAPLTAGPFAARNNKSLFEDGDRGIDAYGWGIKTGFRIVPRGKGGSSTHHERAKKKALAWAAKVVERMEHEAKAVLEAIGAE